jgi:hypothetical protein
MDVDAGIFDHRSSLLAANRSPQPKGRLKRGVLARIAGPVDSVLDLDASCRHHRARIALIGAVGVDRLIVAIVDQRVRSEGDNPEEEDHGI